MCLAWELLALPPGAPRPLNPAFVELHSHGSKWVQLYGGSRPSPAYSEKRTEKLGSSASDELRSERTGEIEFPPQPNVHLLVRKWRSSRLS
jgi:hypothetical protein